MLNNDRYDDWKTITPEDLRHLDNCSCSKCHLAHIENGVIAEQAKKFPCCKAEYEEMIEKGLICRFHPDSYFEPAHDGIASDCEECRLEELGI